MADIVGLLPCPFCGGSSIKGEWVRDGWQFRCLDCHAAASAFNPDATEHAKRRWNTRTALASRSDRSGEWQLLIDEPTKIPSTTPYAQGYKDGVEAAAEAVRQSCAPGLDDYCCCSGDAGGHACPCRGITVSEELVRAIQEDLPIPAGEPGPSRAEIVEALRPLK